MGCKILERNYVGVDKGAVGHYYINMFIAVEAERERGHKQCLVAHVEY